MAFTEAQHTRVSVTLLGEAAGGVQVFTLKLSHEELKVDERREESPLR